MPITSWGGQKKSHVSAEMSKSLSILNWLLNIEFCITKNQKILGCKRILVSVCLFVFFPIPMALHWYHALKKKKKNQSNFLSFSQNFFGGETMEKDWEIEYIRSPPKESNHKAKS